MRKTYDFYFTTVSITHLNWNNFLFIFRNTQYSTARRRMLYLFYCTSSECDQLWTLFRSSLEINSSKSMTEKAQEDIVNSDDWLFLAGIEINKNTYFSKPRANQHEYSVSSNSNKNSFNNNAYLINYFSSNYITDPEDTTKRLLTNYIRDQEVSTKFPERNEFSSDSSSECTNPEYSDPLLVDESLYVNDKNKFIHRFCHEISKFPRQVIRYCFSGTPLLVKPLNNIDLSPCSICGSKKTFEFQVISTIICEWRDAFGNSDFFYKDNSDWSTILAFTCENDCIAGLIEETVIVQSI
ncbi:hypothetical protein FG386_000743 [Cryptosporidium ryanae]|uniref:uncharacterized protein n=1 Tax=Cryptosporidium ryanae TaxID=515981 RepID=UPI00351A85C0|nr:hypothetical protein FG386_000743 [Cryptosporidium ryanae]